MSEPSNGPDRRDPRSNPTADGPTFHDRRRLLQAVGAGVAVVATAGVTAGRAEEWPPDDAEIEDLQELASSLYGVPVPDADLPPPIEPDHEVEAQTRPRADHEIPEFFFEPTGLFVEPGETVRFSFVSPHHSVTAYHPGQGTVQRVPEDVPPFSSPVMSVGSYWLYTFEEPGVYDLHCGPHEAFGHVCRIVVGEVAGPGAEPVSPPDEWPGHEAAGEAGDDGADGADGEDGADGAGGEDGADGADGEDGADGADGEDGADGADGEDGADGADGADGDESADVRIDGTNVDVEVDAGEDVEVDTGGDVEDEDGDEPEPAPEPRPPIATAATVLADPALDPDRIVEVGFVSWDDLDEASRELVALI